MSWWILTLVFVLFFAAVTAWAVYIQTSASRMEQRGFYDNGLGTVIRATDNPMGFRFLVLSYRAFGVVVALLRSGVSSG